MFESVQKYLENDFNVFLLAILVMLVMGKLFAKAAKSLGFAEVSGEILAGILLGPTFLGAMHFDFYQVFTSKFQNGFFNVFFQLSLILLMFMTGLKINVTEATTHLRKTFSIALFGILFPFITGVMIAWFFQNLFVSGDSEYPVFVFPLFMGIAYTISALPVIAKILMDIKLFHTPTGTIIISTAFLVDIICWGIFTLITQLHSPGLSNLFILFGCFIVLYLFKKHWASALSKHIDKNRDVGLIICLCLTVSIIFQFLHFDACLGAFLGGVIFNKFLKSDEIKNILSQWIMNFFAPIFFVSIGIKVDFLTNFNWQLTCLIFVTCSLSKIAGSYIGAHLSGIRGIERTVISLALNARGTIEIIFSTIALNLGIISNPTYVALVIMALLTSILSGILLKRIVHSNEPRLFSTHVESTL